MSGSKRRDASWRDLPGTTVLLWGCDLDSQRLSRPSGPIRIAKEFASHDDEVGFALGQNRFGLLRFGDHAQCAGGNGRIPPDRFCKRHLIARPFGMLAPGIVPPDEQSIPSIPSFLHSLANSID